MTKPEILALISERAEITKRAAGVVLDIIAKSVLTSLTDGKGRMRISNLGTFRVIEMQARKGVNPRTGAVMTIPPMKLPRFTPARALKDAVQNKKK